MDEFQVQIFRALTFVTALALATALQRLMPHERRKGSTRTNVAIWIAGIILLGVVCGACTCAAARWSNARHLGLFAAGAAPWWIAAPVTIVTLDLVSYVWHRMNHTIPFFWRFHRVHHSDSSFTVSTALRFHPGELLLSLPLRLVAVALLAPPVVAVVVFEALFTLANLFEHGDIDLPGGLERRLDRIVITPALHRRHHGVEYVQLQTNFGTVFSIWDRLLGTYGESTSDDDIRTGLSDLQKPLGALASLALPLRPARIGR